MPTKKIRTSEEIEFSLFIEQFKLASSFDTVENVPALKNFTKSPHTVNLFLRDTDVVNYDTFRQAVYVLAGHLNKENNMLAFGGLKRDFQRHIPYCNSKIAFRADLSDRYWNAVTEEIYLPKTSPPQISTTFTALSMEKRNVRITGTARLKASINGIVSNKILEAVVTFPYENPLYKEYLPEIPTWVADHLPPNKFHDDLPDMYLKNDFNWTVGLSVAPPCMDNQILSLVKTSRSNIRLRRLVRLTYKLDMRRDPTQPFPLLRFLLGKGTDNEDSEIVDGIRAEMDEYNDIIIGDFIDSYDNLPLKTLSGYTYLAKKCPDVKWVMFHDDDALINNDRAIKFFNERAKPMNCFGFLGEKQRPHRWAKAGVNQFVFVRFYRYI